MSEVFAKIKRLPENLTNKIAAGEVVDRPASVVKELVENSLDSGADEITVVLRDGGRATIHVIDNGEGMGQADLSLAFQRHATSKIFAFDDLSRIQTLGFRGEALASIASVAQVEARSVPRGAVSGHVVCIEGGEMGDIEACAGTAGSSIQVRNLFFNTPARRKFLKSARAEYRQILAVMSRFCLAYPEVAFTLVNEDTVVYELGRQSHQERIGAVLGARIRDNMLPVTSDGPVRISGFVGNQDVVRRSRGDQYLYFNRRFFSSRNLSYAVVAAYGEMLQRGMYPVYILFIEMEPEYADVNVHPTKMEIKFANDALVFSALRGSVKRALNTGGVVPAISSISPSQTSLSHDVSGQQLALGGADAGSAQLRPTPYSDFNIAGNPAETAKSTAGHEFADGGQNRSRGAAGSLFEQPHIWQVHNKYIFAQIKNGLIVIDQHVAHERILYERALESFEKRSPSSQQLLFPQVIELSPEDYSVLLEMTPFLLNIGFVVKAFGKNTVVVEGVPTDLKIKNDERILLNIVDEYKRGKRDRPEIRENVAASFACHSAVRAGEQLSREAMNALIDQLFSTKEPYFCPHGRPVIVHISLDELDKRFKRA